MRAVIITPFLINSITSCYIPLNNDVIIAADVAFENAMKEGIKPDIIIGDFDHGKVSNFPRDVKIITVPCEKDDTDTMLCIKEAISRNVDEILIIGGIGGRLDHTIANIQSLAYCENNNVKCKITDGKNEAFITSSNIEISNKNGYYLSIFAYGGKCSGLSIKGTKYEVNDVDIDENFPLGVSNEIIKEKATISINNGRLLIITSMKD